jgi:hypothetical protein
MVTTCRPGVVGGKKTCFSSKLYQTLKALADAECHGTDMDLVRSASRKDERLAARARQCLRPEMPAAWRTDPNAWLSNHDLDAVMYQYATAYPSFVYLGTQSIDFMGRRANGQCVSKLCDYDWRKEHKLYGSIVNLDLHTEKGSHWVALLLDCRKPNKPVAYYYDSVGRPWPKQLSSFFESCRARFTGDALRHFMRRSEYNTKTHQRGNTECGMHCLQFMDAMVQGARFKDYCKEAHHDTEAFEKRMLYFSR